MQEAACKGSQHLFFSPHVHDSRCNVVCHSRSEPGQHERVAQARAICNECPVIYDCRAYAMSFPEVDGIWGGMTDRERKAERARLNRAVKASEPTENSGYEGRAS